MRQKYDPERQQQRVLCVVQDYIAQHAFPPTLREIGAAIHLNSSSMVRVTLVRLEMRGLLEIERAPNGIMLARGLRLTAKGRAVARIALPGMSADNLARRNA